MNVAWHDTNLALSWLNYTWAVWPDKSSFILRFHYAFNLDHVEGWDTFGDADDEIHLGLNCFEDGVSCEWWRNVDDRGLSIGSSLGFSDISENWKTQVLRAGLSLVDTSDNIRAILDSLFCVESTLIMEKDEFSRKDENHTYVFTGHTLNEDFGVLVDEDVWHGLLGVDGSVSSWDDTSHSLGWSSHLGDGSG